MSKISRSSTGRRPNRAGSVEVFIRPELSVLVRLLAILWQLRTELTVLVTGVWCWLWLTDRMSRWLAVAVFVVTAGALFAWGPSRRFVVGHAWCTVTRHRLRSCLVQARVMNHRGYVPWTLWVRPTKVGERVWLYMRSGLCAEDLDSKTSQIAAACMARDARVRAWRRLVAVVLVDVVRRDPLTTGRVIRSPLPDLTGDQTSRVRSTVPAGLPGLRLTVDDDQADEPDEADELGRVCVVGGDGGEEWEFGPDASGAVLAEPAHSPILRAVRTARTRPSDTPSGARPVTAKPTVARPVARPTDASAVSSSGEDVSDYV